MKALISPTELITDANGVTGQRVAQVEQVPFEVAPPLYWMDCEDDCTADNYFLVNGVIELIARADFVIPSTDVTSLI